MEMEIAAEVRKWKETTNVVFDALVRRISLVLLRARAWYTRDQRMGDDTDDSR